MPKDRKGPRKIPTSPLLREIRRNKSLRGSKFTIGGGIKKRGAIPITLRLPPEKR